MQIANALVEQADAPPPEAQEGAEEAAANLRMAAEHVVLAQTEMEGATTALGATEAPTGAEPPDPPSDPVSGTSSASDEPALDLPAAREHQDVALVELANALELLTPPQQEGDPGDEGEQDGDGDQDQQEQQQPQQKPQADPSQLLQGVRDREAQRRRDRDQSQSGYDTVEKDW